MFNHHPLWSEDLEDIVHYLAITFSLRISSPGLGCESDFIDPVAHFVDVKGAADGLIVEHHVDGDLAPSGLRRVDREREGVAGLGATSIVRVRNLKQKFMRC